MFISFLDSYESVTVTLILPVILHAMLLVRMPLPRKLPIPSPHLLFARAIIQPQNTVALVPIQTSMFQQPLVHVIVAPHRGNVGAIISGLVLQAVVNTVLIPKILNERQIPTPRRLVHWRVALSVGVWRCRLVSYAEGMKISRQGQHAASVCVVVDALCITVRSTPSLFRHKTEPMHQPTIEPIPLKYHVGIAHQRIPLDEILHNFQLILPHRQLKGRDTPPPAFRVWIGPALFN
mmetsp:Transcript_2689/g.7889  ORF Transcript_2689/g.7889 Transcript_2689/m.7889 type:complete len:235 (+) Transcript_2689:410-1114(+)